LAQEKIFSALGLHPLATPMLPWRCCWWCWCADGRMWRSDRLRSATRPMRRMRRQQLDLSRDFRYIHSDATSARLQSRDVSATRGVQY